MGGSPSDPCPPERPLGGIFQWRTLVVSPSSSKISTTEPFFSVQDGILVLCLAEPTIKGTGEIWSQQTSLVITHSASCPSAQAFILRRRQYRAPVAWAKIWSSVRMAIPFAVCLRVARHLSPGCSFIDRASEARASNSSRLQANCRAHILSCDARPELSPKGIPRNPNGPKGVPRGTKTCNDRNGKRVLLGQKCLFTLCFVGSYRCDIHSLFVWWVLLLQHSLITFNSRYISLPLNNVIGF